MKLRIIKSILIMLTLVGVARGANLLVNSNFEDGASEQFGSAIITGWTAWGTGG